MRTTYTVVTMEVPSHFYELVRKRLLDSGYDVAVDDRTRTLDLTGIALTPEPEEDQPTNAD